MTAAGKSAPRPADLPEIPAGRPLVVVLSGPSGAGKDAVRDLLMAWSLPLHFVVTATDRPPRAGETDGVHYHFLSEAEFSRIAAADGFIEQAVVYGQRKGVPRAEVLDALAAGRDVLARVDVQGAATLKRLVPDCVTIFIAPPSAGEEKRRLTERATETPAEVRLRLATAAAEMAASASFDYIVPNQTGKLPATTRRVVEIIASEKQQRPA